MVRLKIIDTPSPTISVVGGVPINIEVGSVVRESYPRYEGETEIVPKWISQELQTANKTMFENVVIREIEKTETSNESGGITLAI